MADAPTAATLQDEIAFLRSRVAALARATSGVGRTPQDSRDLACMLQILTRAIAVQARLGASNETLADFNETVRQSMIAALGASLVDLTTPSPATNPYPC